ncbi:MAG: NUDIX hydrolase [Solirubrobacteraceae bacterium]|jgi:8-oxo-dGTP pyrophosphatase MutT (NUDIX family)
MSPRGTPSQRTRGEEHSAGGVVLRGEEVLVVVPKRRAANGSTVLGLPKGHIDGDETAEQAARREVREEGGVDAELLEPLGDVHYRYKRGGRLVDKYVRFFLFRYLSGSPEDHDHEIIEARWMPLPEALANLTYPGEREMVGAALSKTVADR